MGVPKNRKAPDRIGGSRTDAIVRAIDLLLRELDKK